MVETCKKVQMAYIASMDTVPTVENSTDESKEEEKNGFNEAVSTEVDAVQRTMELDDTITGEKLLPTDAETSNGVNDAEHHINGIVVEAPNVHDALAIQAEPETVDIKPPLPPPQPLVPSPPPPPTSDDDLSKIMLAVPQSTFNMDGIQDDVDISMDSDNDILQIDAKSEAENDDLIASASTEKVQSRAMQSASSTPIMSPCQSPTLTPATSPMPTDTVDSIKIEKIGKCFSFSCSNCKLLMVFY